MSQLTIATTKGYNQVTIGDELDDLVIDITPRLIVATALASRDYQNVHHDYQAATDLGTPDIFMNILTTNGFVGRFVTDWSGANGELKSVKIKLGMPNYPGDSMTLKGEVIDKKQFNGLNLVTIDIKGKNSMGYHVTGSVTVSLPSEQEQA